MQLKIDEDFIGLISDIRMFIDVMIQSSERIPVQKFGRALIQRIDGLGLTKKEYETHDLTY